MIDVEKLQAQADELTAKVLAAVMGEAQKTFTTLPEAIRRDAVKLRVWLDMINTAKGQK